MRLSLLAVLTVLLTGCLSMRKSEIGMTEKQWLESTLFGDLESETADETVWRSGGRYYHFKNGVLVKITSSPRREVTVTQ